MSPDDEQLREYPYVPDGAMMGTAVVQPPRMVAMNAVPASSFFMVGVCVVRVCCREDLHVLDFHEVLGSRIY